MRPINQACKMHVQILESKLGLHRLCSFCINTYTHTIILNVVVTGGRGRRNNLDGETDANILDMDM